MTSSVPVPNPVDVGWSYHWNVNRAASGAYATSLMRALHVRESALGAVDAGARSEASVRRAARGSHGGYPSTAEAFKGPTADRVALPARLDALQARKSELEAMPLESITEVRFTGLTVRQSWAKADLDMKRDLLAKVYEAWEIAPPLAAGAPGNREGSPRERDAPRGLPCGREAAVSERLPLHREAAAAPTTW